MAVCLRTGLAAAVLAAPAAGAQAQQVADAVFLDTCRQQNLAANPGAASWVDGVCGARLERADASGLLVEALLALAPAAGAALPPLNAATTALPGIPWSPGDAPLLLTGPLGDVQVALMGSKEAVSAMGLYWEEQAGYPPYDVLGSLRMRGASVATLGCPVFPMASAGQEKVVAVEAPGHAPFVLAVYHRPAPTGNEWGLYHVDAGFGGALPSLAQLAEGAYPGGGGRAFAPEVSSWVPDCPDPS
jgi:hypothetical protein